MKYGYLLDYARVNDFRAGDKIYEGKIYTDLEELKEEIKDIIDNQHPYHCDCNEEPSFKNCEKYTVEHDYLGCLDRGFSSAYIYYDTDCTDVLWISKCPILEKKSYQPIVVHHQFGSDIETTVLDERESEENAKREILKFTMDKNEFLFSMDLDIYLDNPENFYRENPYAKAWNDIDKRMKSCSYTTYNKEFREELLKEFSLLDRLNKERVVWKIIERP
jgi:hypothetical protein